MVHITGDVSLKQKGNLERDIDMSFESVNKILNNQKSKTLTLAGDILDNKHRLVKIKENRI